VCRTGELSWQAGGLDWLTAHDLPPPLLGFSHIFPARMTADATQYEHSVRTAPHKIALREASSVAAFRGVLIGPAI